MDLLLFDLAEHRPFLTGLWLFVGQLLDLGRQSGGEKERLPRSRRWQDAEEI